MINRRSKSLHLWSYDPEAKFSHHSCSQDGASATSRDRGGGEGEGGEDGRGTSNKEKEKCIIGIIGFQ